MAWFWLILGGAFEVGFTTSLRFVDGFRNLPWTIAFLVSVAISMGLLELASRSIPMGTAYAVWGGIGADRHGRRRNDLVQRADDHDPPAADPRHRGGDCGLEAHRLSPLANDEYAAARSRDPEPARRRRRPLPRGGRRVRPRAPPVRFQARRGSGHRADRGLCANHRRDHRRRLQGNVHVRGSRRRADHAPARVHRRDLPGLPQRRLAAVRATEACDAWPGLPLRTAAEGPLPPVPPARRRSDRSRRSGGGRGTAVAWRSAARGAGHSRWRDASAQHAR